MGLFPLMLLVPVAVLYLDLRYRNHPTNLNLPLQKKIVFLCQK